MWLLPANVKRFKNSHMQLFKLTFSLPAPWGFRGQSLAPDWPETNTSGFCRSRFAFDRQDAAADNHADNYRGDDPDSRVT